MPGIDTSVEYSKRRLEAFLDSVSKLKSVEFPYDHSREALEEIELTFEDARSYLDKLAPGSSADVKVAACSQLLQALFEFLPYLGFLLRSTNVRNGFEAYGPLLSLTRLILGADRKLVISSEWSDYSPITYPRIPALPGFVLIGLPAPESSNPLLVPLAGHELGHSLWADQGLDAKFSPIIEDEIVAQIRARWDTYSTFFKDVDPEDLQTDIFARKSWEFALNSATSQVEEGFCDLVGLIVFGESYLHAFAYLLAPIPSQSRSRLYPTVKSRAAALVSASDRFREMSKNVIDIRIPPDYVSMFAEQKASLAPPLSFLLEVADEVFSQMTSKLEEEVYNQLQEKVGSFHREDAVSKCLSAFRIGVPPKGADSLPSILNAGWRAFHDETIWSKNFGASVDEHELLEELVLKSMEVFEIESIPAAAE